MSPVDSSLNVDPILNAAIESKIINDHINCL